MTARPGDAAHWSLRARTGSAGDTRRLACSLSAVSRAGDVILLVGGLGAGKTTFAQGFADGLGIAGPVTSPTFTLVRQYPCAGPDGVRQLVHADVYRLESLAEVVDLGLPELVEDGAVALVEWGDVAAPALGPGTLTVELARPAVGSRAEASPTAGTGALTDPGPLAEAGAPEGGADGDEPRWLTVTGDGDPWDGRRAAVAEVLAPFDPGAGTGGQG